MDPNLKQLTDDQLKKVESELKYEVERREAMKLKAEYEEKSKIIHFIQEHKEVLAELAELLYSKETARMIRENDLHNGHEFFFYTTDNGFHKKIYDKNLKLVWKRFEQDK